MTSIIKSIISLLFILIVGLYGSKQKIITPEINNNVQDNFIKPYNYIRGISIQNPVRFK